MLHSRYTLLILFNLLGLALFLTMVTAIYSSPVYGQGLRTPQPTAAGVAAVNIAVPTTEQVIVPTTKQVIVPTTEQVIVPTTEQVPSPTSTPEPHPPPDCALAAEAFSPKVMAWCPLITKWATETGLDPHLLAALITQESGGNHLAYSKSGAVGLMQVMPRDGLAAAFQCPNGPCFADRPTIKELQDPDFNIAYGSRMLAGLVAKYDGNLRQALYRYGPINMGYRYADIVLGIYERSQ